MNLIDKLISLEESRQQRMIHLNAALSCCPANVRSALHSAFLNIDAEGLAPAYLSEYAVEALENVEVIRGIYQKKRDNRANKCCEYFNIAELFTQRMLARVFSNMLIGEKQIFVNVQVPTGAIANLCIYQAFLKENDRVLSAGLSYGGHLSHGADIHYSGKHYRVLTYGVTARNELDYDQIQHYLMTERPRLVIAGASSFPRKINWCKIRELIDQYSPDTLFMADIAHTAGLIAGGVFPSPFGYADIISMVGYKTFCGARSAAVFTTNIEHSKKLNRAVFPGILGSPINASIMAMAVSAQNANENKYKRLMACIVNNARVMAKRLKENGIQLCFDGTDTHMVIIDLKQSGINLNGEMAANLLEDCRILVNKNMIPGDVSNANATGVRIGLTWATQIGFNEEDICDLSDQISEILIAGHPSRDSERIYERWSVLSGNEMDYTPER